MIGRVLFYLVVWTLAVYAIDVRGLPFWPVALILCVYFVRESMIEYRLASTAWRKHI